MDMTNLPAGPIEEPESDTASTAPTTRTIREPITGKRKPWQSRPDHRATPEADGERHAPLGVAVTDSSPSRLTVGYCVRPARRSATAHHVKWPGQNYLIIGKRLARWRVLDGLGLICALER